MHLSVRVPYRLLVCNRQLLHERKRHRHELEVRDLERLVLGPRLPLELIDELSRDDTRRRTLDHRHLRRALEHEVLADVNRAVARAHNDRALACEVRSARVPGRVHDLPAEELDTVDTGHDWSTSLACSHYDMRGAEVELFAVSDDGDSPATGGGIVLRTRFELCAQPNDEVLCDRILLEPAGDLVSWGELGPGRWVWLVQYCLK